MFYEEDIALNTFVIFIECRQKLNKNPPGWWFNLSCQKIYCIQHKSNLNNCKIANCKLYCFHPPYLLLKWHRQTPDMWNQTHLSPAAEEWSVSNIPSWDPICLLSISPGLGDWVCETDSQSHHNKGSQPPTHLGASIHFPCTSRTDHIGTRQTAGREWNPRQ